MTTPITTVSFSQQLAVHLAQVAAGRLSVDQSASTLDALIDSWTLGAITPAQIGIQQATFLANWNAFTTNQLDWQVTPATGGPHSDGTVDLTDYLGNVSTVWGLQKIIDLATGVAPYPDNSFLTFPTASTSFSGLRFQRDGDASRSLEFTFDGSIRALELNRFDTSTGAFIETTLLMDQLGGVYFLGGAGIIVTNRARASAVQAYATIPALSVLATGAATDKKIWDLISDSSGAIQLRAVNDAYSSASQALTITRSGTTPGAWNFYGTGYSINTSASGASGIVGTGTISGSLTWLISNPTAGAQGSAFQLQTHASGSTAQLFLNDNSGSPYLILGTGAAVSAIYYDSAVHNFRSQAGSLYWSMGGNLLAGTDNTFDIGGTATFRPRNGNFAGTVVAGNGMTVPSGSYRNWTGSTVLRNSGGDGTIRILEHTETDYFDFGVAHNSGSPLGGLTAGATIQHVQFNIPDLQIRSVAGSEWARFSAGALLINTTTAGGWASNSVMEAVATGGSLDNAVSGYVSGATTVGSAFIARVDDSAGYLMAYFYGTGLVGSVQTNGSTTSFNTSSDERLKVFDLESYSAAVAADIIRRDPVRTFTWNEHAASPGARSIGWGAQTSYGITPDLATPGHGEPGDEHFRPWGMDLAKRTTYLWAVIGGASGVLDQLDALRADNADLHTQIDALKRAA